MKYTCRQCVTSPCGTCEKSIVSRGQTVYCACRCNAVHRIRNVDVSNLSTQIRALAESFGWTEVEAANAIQKAAQ